MDDFRAALATEQTAHRRAVQQYVDALDAKSAMQLQFEASQQALQELSCAHQTLQQQHQELQQRHSGLVSQCCVVRDICKHLDEALGLDPQLVQQVQQWREANSSSPDSAPQGLQAHTQQDGPMQPLPSQQQDQQSGQDEQQSSTDGEAPLQEDPERPCSAAEPNGATDLQPLAEKLEQQMQAMYASWRSATNARDAALTERFRMADQLRDSEQAAYQLQQQHKALQQVLQEAQQHLSGSQVRKHTYAHMAAAAITVWGEVLSHTWLHMVSCVPGLQIAGHLRRAVTVPGRRHAAVSLYPRDIMRHHVMCRAEPLPNCRLRMPT